MIKRYFLRHPIRTRRALEILPGFISWSLILFPFWGSFVFPTVVAYYVITFAVYWLYRSISISILAVIAHFKIKASMKFDWLKDIQAHYPARWNQIHHIIIIPTYQEPLTTLQRTLRSVILQTFPHQNLHIMLSFEEREGDAARRKAEELHKEFSKEFGHLWSTYHPDIDGEVKGKSSNTSWGAKLAKKMLVDDEGISIGDITISSEDADAMFDKQYFAYLTREFLSSKKPYNKIWQGGIMFYNNIWKVYPPVRVLASVFSITQIYILMRRDRLVNFSTYSTSLKHVDDIGYWDTDVIPEDYRLFFKSYFAKKGDFEVEPIFLPIYADAPEGKNFLSAMNNQYQQLQRWAWGASDDAYIIRQFILVEGVPFWDKAVRVFKTIEDHFLWPVNWFAITTAAFLPPLLNHEFNRTQLGARLPQTTSFLLTMSLISMLVIFLLDSWNRPPRPHRRNIFSYLFQPIEFFMLPVIGFFFSALPGLDAHTRLMLGKYIEYRVTEKQ